MKRRTIDLLVIITGDIRVINVPSSALRFRLMPFIGLGPVARSLFSANRWLRGIKMYRFPWYLTLVSTNHASSNPGLVFNNSCRSLFVSGALEVLEQEISPHSFPAGSSKKYRKSLALGLFYKVLNNFIVLSTIFFFK